MLDFLIASVQLDPIAIIKTGSYLGIALIVFAESGLLVGIFFPGDSLLFAAGLLSAAGFLALGPLIFFVVAAAIIGDSVGYWFGAHVGTGFFQRKDSRFFKQEYLKRTDRFFQKYGGRAIILARLIAGIGSMTYKRFLSYNVVGGLLWGAGMILLGYSLGSIIPDSERYILPLSLVIIVISFLPILTSVMREKNRANDVLSDNLNNEI